jgi:MFS family permease
MEKNIKATQRRAVQYWFADGLAELIGGAMCLLLAIYFIIQQILQAAQGSFAIIFLIVFVVAFGIRKLMLRFRERSTYLHTGFVEPKKGWGDRRLLGVEVGFTLLLLGVMLYTILRGIQTVEWMPALSGSVLAFIFALAGFKTNLVRFIYLAIFCLLLGVVLALNGLGDLLGAAVLALITGLVLFAFGIITRMAYLHQIKVSVEQADER